MESHDLSMSPGDARRPARGLHWGISCICEMRQKGRNMVYTDCDLQRAEPHVQTQPSRAFMKAWSHGNQQSSASELRVPSHMVLITAGSAPGLPRNDHMTPDHLTWGTNGLAERNFSFEKLHWARGGKWHGEHSGTHRSAETHLLHRSLHSVTFYCIHQTAKDSFKKKTNDKRCSKLPSPFGIFYRNVEGFVPMTSEHRGD